MSAQSLFSKKNIESHQPDTRTGLMEELNLPPAVIAFVRNNARNLQIALAAIVVMVLAWVFYDYYSQKQASDAASLLASAMQTEVTDERIQMLDNVITDYSGTDAARWSKIEQAHLDYREGRFDAAIEKYEKILAEVPDENPLAPLIMVNLAQSYEEATRYDQAIARYTLLKKFSGFAVEAHLGLGRIYTAKDEPALARNEYEELLNTLGDEADPQFRSQVQAFLVAAGGAEAGGASKPEENKE